MTVEIDESKFGKKKVSKGEVDRGPIGFSGGFAEKLERFSW